MKRSEQSDPAKGPEQSGPALKRPRIVTRIWNDTFLYTLLAIFIGLLAGSLILLITGFNPISAYATLFLGIFGSFKTIMYSVQYATPIIFTGLAVTFAFKTGLFNIGAEGQYIMGGISALAVSLLLPLPAGIHGIVCVLAGGLAGACLGGIAGFLKAYKGIHEVIVTIMLNWIAFYLSNFLVMSPAFKKPSSTASQDIAETSRIYTDAFRETLGTVKVHWGMLLALAAVFLCWLILNKTTLGYRLRAVGFNRNAAEYGGIPVARSIVTSMGISGLLAGLGGATQVLGVVGRITQLAAQEGYGFDGISVSMIGGINPIGALFAGLFYGGMKYGSSKLNTIGAPSELVNVIIGVIIYSIAIMGAFRVLIKFIKAKKEGRPL
ncbi:inner-membrane translocator [Treponema primitia ZAS-2]|uniref:Inner-membrane translocator n=1 Tax=Treponema primitia (strain ATCC BAA-887 / DSM 12427 / ZAS-2) TaxID=545694 RepID=F5YIU2_TREPZ|nr:ABC transporter permease [Treponema primitia]AEF85200.1 inner-membrane translocator [Treponema primitia ZAS-2]